MGQPKFTAPAETEFAKRVRRALALGKLDVSEAAAKLTADTGNKVKPQTVQYMAQKAKKSHLTADLAKICGVDFDWLRDASGPDPESSSPKLEDQHREPTFLDPVRREQIYSRLLAEIRKTKRKPIDVARCLRMTEREFIDRASHGDLTLEDLAETVNFLGESASLDFIVLGRFPKGDLVGPAGEIFEGIRLRATKKKSKTS